MAGELYLDKFWFPTDSASKLPSWTWTSTVVNPECSAAGRHSRFWFDARCRFARFTKNREWEILNQLSSPLSKCLASFGSDSAEPNSAIQGHRAAFSLNIVLYLNVIRQHCLVCGQTHNKWWPAMSNFPGSMVIKLVRDAEQIQRRKNCLHLQHTFSEADLNSHKWTTSYCLQKASILVPLNCLSALHWTFPETADNNPGVGCNVLFNMVAIFLSKHFKKIQQLKKLHYGYQQFEQPTSQLLWCLGLNFVFLLSI